MIRAGAEQMVVFRASLTGMSKLIAGFVFLGALIAIPSVSAQTAKQDIKDAGKDVKEAGKATGNAAKKAGKATAKESKKAAHATAKTVKKGADKVEEKSR
jgi:hypothetical protein